MQLVNKTCIENVKNRSFWNNFFFSRICNFMKWREYKLANHALQLIFQYSLMNKNILIFILIGFIYNNKTWFSLTSCCHVTLERWAFGATCRTPEHLRFFSTCAPHSLFLKWIKLCFKGFKFHLNSLFGPIIIQESRPDISSRAVLASSWSS